MLSISADGSKFVASAAENSDIAKYSGSIRVCLCSSTSSNRLAAKDFKIGSDINCESVGDILGDLLLTISFDGSTFVAGKNPGIARAFQRIQ